MGDNIRRTQERIEISIKWDAKRDRKGYVNETQSLGGRDEPFEDQGTDLNKAQTGRSAHRKATKLLIISDERA